MTSKFDICSQSLLSLGENIISSFEANTPSSQICGQIYPSYIKYLLSLYPWAFNTKKVQLARLNETPINEYQYKYELPADLLVLNAVYNSNAVSVITNQQYQIFQGQLFTNYDKVYIDYQFQIAEEEMPPYFIEFVTKALASVLAIPITQDKQLAQLKKIEAFGSPSDNLNGGEFGVAKRIDSMQQPTMAIRADELLAARIS